MGCAGTRVSSTDIVCAATTVSGTDMAMLLPERPVQGHSAQPTLSARQGVESAICLRAAYALCGTGIPYGAI
eukprot:524437-Rhodomonas_salina.6